MLGVVKPQLVLPEIDCEFERAGRKNAFVLVLYLVAFVKPKVVYKSRKRRRRIVRVDFGIDVWGILTVSKGALMNPTFSRIYVSVLSNLSTPPIQGDGWTLELNAGWTVAVGERKGDYVVKKLE